MISQACKSTTVVESFSLMKLPGQGGMEEGKEMAKRL